MLKLLFGVLLAFQTPSEPEVTKVAHRGGRALAPENTLAALRAGMTYDVDFIEIDVHQTADSVVILHHDETLDRCTNGSGRIDQTPYSVIQKLDAGSWFSPDFVGEKVPSLAEAMKLVKGQCGLWIEIKGGGKEYPGMEKRIVELIQLHEAHAWVQVISFDTEALRNIHTLDPKIKLQKLLVSNLGAFPFFMDKGLRVGSPRRLDFVDSFGIYHKSINKRFVKRVHRWGKKCNVWTVNEAKEVAKLKAMGIDGITTDDPKLIARPRSLRPSLPASPPR